MTSRALLVIGDRRDQYIGDSAPRRDFEVLAARLSADILDASAVAPGGRTSTGIRLARIATRRASDYDAVYADSEHIGIPLAFLLRGRRAPRLTVLAHYLTPRKKRLVIRALGVTRRIDCLVLHSQAQAARARSLGFRDSQIAVVPYQVDTAFWRDQTSAGSTQDYIASAGQEFRDYGTLIRALRDTSIQARIAAGSLWSSRRATYRDADVPANVSIARRSYAELRDLYAGARFVVVPLVDVDFQAGIITILESMAMGKAVIVSRTRGQTGTVSGELMTASGCQEIGEHTSPEQTGIYVPPADPAALLLAIERLLADPALAAAMGAAGRRFVEANTTVEQFAERLAALISGTPVREPARASDMLVRCDEPH